MRIAILAVHFLKDISRSAVTNYLDCFTSHIVLQTLTSFCAIQIQLMLSHFQSSRTQIYISLNIAVQRGDNCNCTSGYETHTAASIPAVCLSTTMLHTKHS